MGRVTASHTSPIDLADNAFRAATESPSALVLDFDLAHLAPELSRDAVHLAELRTLLLAGASQSVRDAVWAELVRQARRCEAWKLAAVGMAVPALRAVAGSLSRGFDGDREELDAEIVAGFLAHLAVVDIAAPGIITKLRWAAYRAGHAVVVAHRRTAAYEEATETAGGSQPSGHPDLVLARAVDASAISAADADLISATRLGGTDLEDYAAQLGVSYNAVKIRRQRAEARLIAFVTGVPRPRADEARIRRMRRGRDGELGRSAELLVAA